MSPKLSNQFEGSVWHTHSYQVTPISDQ